MNNAIKYLAVFATGFAAGVGFKVLVDKRASTTEVVVEAKPEEDHKVEEETEDDDPEMEVYEQIVKDNYTNPEEAGEDYESRPHAVSVNDYTNMCPQYDRITWNYYELDDVFLDENDEPVDDPIKYLGHNITKAFGLMSGDPDICYVRNDQLGIFYELVCHHENAPY